MDEPQKHRGVGGFDSGEESQGEMACAMAPERRTNGADRRKTSSPGFMFISTVGWICRREIRRRDTDPAPID